MHGVNPWDGKQGQLLKEQISCLVHRARPRPAFLRPSTAAPLAPRPPFMPTFSLWRLPHFLPFFSPSKAALMTHTPKCSPTTPLLSPCAHDLHALLSPPSQQSSPHRPNPAKPRHPTRPSVRPAPALPPPSPLRPTPPGLGRPFICTPTLKAEPGLRGKPKHHPEPTSRG